MATRAHAEVQSIGLVKKKKHNWMAGFFPAKRLDDLALIRTETIKRICDKRNKVIKHRG